MLVGGTFLDRLRPLVGSNGWDYCVVWRLNEEQGVLDGQECYCAAAAAAAAAACVNNVDKRDELLHPVSSGFSCRDVSFCHQKSACCEFLSQLPSSVPLDDSGVYSVVLFSSQPRWFNILDSPNTNNALEETTRVLIPVPGGLVELFVAKQVLEDQQVVDFVVDQYSNQLEHQAFHVSSVMTQIPEAFTNGYDMDVTMTNGASSTHGEPYTEHSKDVNDKDSVKPEVSSRRSNSLSDCSDQIDDDDDDAGSRKRSGKKPQAKNLEAERRRRKKLNERLYNLRSLVPIISKLDKASILVDAITYLKSLKTQEKELQDELEELSNCAGAENNDTTNSDALADYLSCTGVQNGPNNLIFSALDSMQQSPLVTGVSDTIIEDNKGQQMEPQVEVTEIDASKFFIRVFCEHKPGGLVRLLEALSLLGLEVMNVNVTSCRMLVSNVFEVELKRDREVVAEDLKNSLLELTRIPFGSGWMHDQQLLSKPDIGSDIYYHSFLNHHASPYHQQN